VLRDADAEQGDEDDTERVEPVNVVTIVERKVAMEVPVSWLLIWMGLPLRGSSSAN
jgi:hypothetical protein